FLYGIFGEPVTTCSLLRSSTICRYTNRRLSRYSSLVLVEMWERRSERSWVLAIRLSWKRNALAEAFGLCGTKLISELKLFLPPASSSMLRLIGMRAPLVWRLSFMRHPRYKGDGFSGTTCVGSRFLAPSLGSFWEILMPWLTPRRSEEGRSFTKDRRQTSVTAYKTVI
ncbi:hypothetical protein LINPERHAP2_LOCUS35253, partial [Linum perenne]